MVMLSVWNIIKTQTEIISPWTEFNFLAGMTCSNAREDPGMQCMGLACVRPEVMTFNQPQRLGDSME